MCMFERGERWGWRGEGMERGLVGGRGKGREEGMRRKTESEKGIGGKESVAVDTYIRFQPECASHL